MGKLKKLLKGTHDFGTVLAEIVEDWIEGAEANVDDWEQGVIVGYQEWKPNLLKFLNSPEARKWFTEEMISHIKAGVESITPEEFKEAIEGKGTDWVEGFKKNAKKYAKKIAPVLLYELELLKKIQTIPDPERRMIEWRRGMMAYKKVKPTYTARAREQAVTVTTT